MTAVVLDTHVIAWAFLDSERLSAQARRTLTAASTVLVSAASYYEIGYKVRLGKWPSMEAHLAALPSLIDERGGQGIDLDPSIMILAAQLSWSHRDPFDRMLAATAFRLGVALVSADPAFDDLSALPGWPGRIW